MQPAIENILNLIDWIVLDDKLLQFTIGNILNFLNINSQLNFYYCNHDTYKLKKHFYTFTVLQKNDNLNTVLQLQNNMLNYKCINFNSTGIITNFKIFTNLTNLSLYNVNNLQMSNLNILNNLEFLKFNDCHFIDESTDLLKLKLLNLNIRNCTFTSINLRKATIKNIYFSRMNSMDNIFLPLTVEYLNIDECNLLTQICLDQKSHVYKLYIFCYNLIKVVLPLSNNTVYINNCHKLTTLKLSHNTEILHIINCNNLKKYDNFKYHNIRHLHISCTSLNSILNLSPFKYLNTLTLICCSKLHYIIGLEKIVSLNITDCSKISKNITSILNLKSSQLEMLKINKCYNMTNLELYNNFKLKHLELNECNNVQTLNFSGCPNLQFLFLNNLYKIEYITKKNKTKVEPNIINEICNNMRNNIYNNMIQYV